MEEADFSSDVINLIDLQNAPLGSFEPGKVSGVCGKAAFEYIKKSINFMLDKAKNDGSSNEVVGFVERVYKYVSYDMFEMLKEQRDCFLEFDNFYSKEDKQKYLEDYI